MPRELRSTAVRGRLALSLLRGILAGRLWGRRRPLLMNLEITHRCNLRCRFCDLARPDAPQLDETAGLRILDDLARAGAVSVCFNGGEPLLHPGLGRFVERAHGHGLRVALSTNGTLLPQRLHELGGVDLLKVSLDGPAEIHDAGRGVACRERALEGARLAVAAGRRVALRMTVGRHNQAHWRHVLDTAASLGAGAVFQPVVGSLTDVDAPPGAASPEPAAWRALVRELRALKRAGAPVANEDACLEDFERWPSPAPVPACAGGRIQGALAPDGRLYVCGRVRRNPPGPDAIALGVREAFRRLAPPRDCGDCWCALTRGTCHLYGLDPRLILARIRAGVA